MREMREQIREITLWGVPLLPSKGHESTDTILLKFLNAKGFMVQEAFNMLQKTLQWRKEFNADAILEENLDTGIDLDKLLYIHSVDKEGHPLYYALYGAFKDKGLYSRILGTEKSRERFLRWRIQFLEKSIKNLTFKAGEVDSILQIRDFKHDHLRPRTEMKELHDVSKKIFLLVQANYPEMIYKNAGVTIVWDFTVVGWQVTCREEFVPDDEGSYRVLLRKYKGKRMGESVRNSFYISEPGKLVLTIENTTIKKRRVFYRSKTKPFVPTFNK
ncbi:hypothetical protein JCGZ_17686 [Jatropha curcas]|uniref:CRAL/TRIO N-terminal domain-containing protein n=1 Tax=Jatropha curcas TaxID=180498 RepID=A0A067JUM1_JATCU|nr:hypothetical protein JCGZ_17686 [Jatropha curcas]